LFLALSFIGFAQQRGNLFVVPHWTTNFTMSLPAQSLVQCTDSGKIYRLLAIGQPTKNLSNTANVDIFSTILSSTWSLTGNSGTIDTVNFIGTTDNVPFNIRVNNQNAGRIEHIGKNTTFGYTAGNSFTTAFENTAVGYEALHANTSGYANVAIGHRELTANINGIWNTAVGMDALAHNISGGQNTAV